MNDLEKKSIECIKNMPIEETTYQVARNVVLDYITNLQQENTLLKHNCKQAQNSCRQHRLASKNHIRRLQRREKQIEDYKSRIEKAVEYIEKSKEINYKTIDTLSEEVKLLKGILNGENVMLNNILNILNGRSDE